MGFQVKYNGEGRVKCFKVWLIAQGFSQKNGIDYDEFFSATAHFSSICTLPAFAAEKRMLFHQMDVSGAFLNGELKEGIYMQQQLPQGYVQSRKEELVCRLKNPSMD